MANKVNLIQVEQAIRRRGLRLFSPLELQRVLGISAIAARFLVHRYAKIPILMFTARAQQEDMKLAQEVGADAYVMKPFEPEMLLAKVQELLRPSPSA